MDREAWRAAVRGVTKSWTWLSDWTELNWTDSGIHSIAKFPGVFKKCLETLWRSSERMDSSFPSCVCGLVLETWFQQVECGGSDGVCFQG